MDPFDAESIADWLYATGGVDPAEPIGAEALARRIPGIAGIRDDAMGLFRAGALTWAPSGWTIWVGRRMSLVTRNWTVAHELMEFANRHVRGEPFLERACNQGAAAIVAPRQAFRLMHAAVGPSLPELAGAFVTTESVVALRLGEVIGTPVALVAPSFVRHRGARYGWPEGGILRRMVKARALPPGHDVIRLADAPKRFAVLAEAG